MTRRHSITCVALSAAVAFKLFAGAADVVGVGAETDVRKGNVLLTALHDASGRLDRMRAAFPDADAVVFGHSHIPLHEERDGFAIFNPGSPTERRRSPHHTMGVATVDHAQITFELLELD